MQLLQYRGRKYCITIKYNLNSLSSLSASLSLYLSIYLSIYLAIYAYIYILYIFYIYIFWLLTCDLWKKSSCEKKRYKTFKEKFEICDIWRVRDKKKITFHYKHNSEIIQRHLDYFFICNSYKRFWKNLSDCTSLFRSLPILNIKKRN